MGRLRDGDGPEAPAAVLPEQAPTEPITYTLAGLKESQRQVGSHVGRLLSGELVNKLCRFIALLVLARALSASAFGLLNVGIAISGIALVAASLGLPDLGARDASVAPERAGWLTGHVAATRILVLATISGVGIVTAMFVWPGHTLLLTMAAVMAIFMAGSGDWLARGLERMSLVAASSAAGGVTVLVAAAAVAKLSGGAAAALGAFAVAEGVVAGVLWTKLHRFSRVDVGVRGIGPMLRRARPLAISSLAIYFYYANLDTVILAASHSDREAGLYSAPYRVFLVLNLVGVFAAYALLPSFARLAASDRQADADMLIRSFLGALAGYGLAILGLVEVAGAEALGVLFGAPFRAASGTFVLLASGVAWYAIGYPAGYSLIARAENARFLRGAATASVLNVALDIALIPPLGMLGAGLATMVAFTVAAFVWLTARGLLDRALLPVVVPLTATSATAIIVTLSHNSTTIAGWLTLALAAVSLISRFSPKFSWRWMTAGRGGGFE